MGAAMPGGRYGVLVAGIGGLGTRGLLIKGAPRWERSYRSISCGWRV